MNTLVKPKLLFFQNKYDDSLPNFLLTHKQEHINCLAWFFDVTVVQHDCDYQQVCDLYQPDLALFETGVNLTSCRKPKISNVRACRTVPKLGLFNADAWCETRSGSLSEMDQWGIETYFSISTTAAQHMPSIANRLFVWPNFIDPAIFRNYGEAKLIPILLSGATAAQYPWRRRVYKLIAEYYPSLSCPHRGYLSRSSAGQMLSGVRYARTINASEIAPVCGTIAKEVVRKHFEIPACNTCLVTERARNLEDAGFIDMTNCVFADEHDILDKLEFLFTRPDDLRRITAAGYQLVHSRHTYRDRDQILQWYKLNQNLGANEKIVQVNPFAPLSVLSAGFSTSLSNPDEVGTHLKLLKRGDEALLTGQVGAAEKKYQSCLSYMRKLPEARFKIALCDIYKGNAAKANSRLFELIRYSISQYGANDPDPVEWSYYIISLLCMGKLPDAMNCVSEFPWLHHTELDRVRRTVYSLSRRNNINTLSTFESSMTTMRPSVHQLPERTETIWREEIYSMLLACGQLSMAEELLTTGHKLEPAEKYRSATDRRRPFIIEHHEDDPNKTQAFTVMKSLIRIFNPHTFGHKLARHTGQQKLRNIGTRIARLMRRFHITPQTSSTDPHLPDLVRELVRDLNINRTLVVGDGVPSQVTNAVQEGTLGNDELSIVCYVNHAEYALPVHHGATLAQTNVKRYSLSSRLKTTSRDLEKVIKDIKSDNLIEEFDLLICASVETNDEAGIAGVLRKEMRAAKAIVLVDPESEHNRQIYTELMERSNYILFADSTANGSHMIFKQNPHAQTHIKSRSEYSLSSVYID